MCRGRLKVDLLKEHLDELGLDTCIETLPKRIDDSEGLAELRGVDVLFGCVDRHWPRYILSRLAVQYVLPVIDLGTEIAATDGRVDAVNARVSYLSAGRPCLVCSGIVSPRQVRLESLSPVEREQELSLGYANFPMRQPAVMDLNMRAAGLAVLLLRHLLQPFMREPLPVHFRESVATASIKSDNAARDNRPCPYCEVGAFRGSGDWGPPVL
ncbi:MAG: ThiF family adenylyltransferase [Chloroflexi bacterium]|nr:ThiF family adenylyltransferase [Chloroflexota bacterium]